MAQNIRKLQLTLAILKPDVISQPQITREIKDLILQNNFLFVKSRNLFLPRRKAEEFYSEHEGRFFYNRLVSFMSSGPISAHILAREDAIAAWRKLMGPTKVFRTIYEAPDSIRGRYGLTDTRNCTHGSDSETTARREISFFFPNFSIEDWYSKEESYFARGQVVYDSQSTEHHVDR